MPLKFQLNNNNNTLIYIAPACRMTSEAQRGTNLFDRTMFMYTGVYLDCAGVTLMELR